jgi:glycosyltransferase involved in cell wall biosynthesis
MKFKLTTCFFLVLCFQQVWCDPLLVVVLMVKDEAPVIEATLQPFVEGGVHDFVIFDTGSTDGTPDVAANFFKQHPTIHAHIIQESFIDFSTSRNHALDTAQNLFPQALFMLMPDAEWYMHNVEGLLQFCKEHQYDHHASYLVPIRSDIEALHTSRLLRCHKNIRFVRVVHEALNQISQVTLPDDIYFEWRPSQKGNEKSARRWLRDRDLLLKSYTENPHDLRTLFYLGQTYECLGDGQNAYRYYKERSAYKGWDEEDFVTMYRLGRVAQMLAPENHQSFAPLAVEHYLTAFTMRPHRIEPLVKIAQYYVDRNEMHLAFLFASRAVKISYPAQDRLFVEKYMYDFVRYDILGICAWYVGEYELGEWAVMQALEVAPQAEYLKRNLKFYIDRKA